MRRLIATIATAVLAAGCTIEDNEPDRAFQGGGQNALPAYAMAYPSDALWGTKVGEVVPNWSFIGFANSQDPSLIGVQQVQLAEFYNPTGDEKFPAGSPWAGQPKPKALSLGSSAVWCPPCNAEAKYTLNPKYEGYKPQGGHILNALVDGKKPGIAATIQEAQSWVTKYKVPYSMVVDPSGQLERLFEPLLPSNAIVTTKDMVIRYVISGGPIDPKEPWPAPPQPETKCIPKPGSCAQSATDPMVSVCNGDSAKTCTADADCGPPVVCADNKVDKCTTNHDCHICVRSPDEPNCKYWENFEKALAGGF